MGNKVFIIQAMNSRSDDEILSERRAIVERLREYGYEPIDSYISEDAPEWAYAPVWYLGRSVELLSRADYIYLTPGWEAGRGCRIEQAIAEEYNIPEVIL